MSEIEARCVIWTSLLEKMQIRQELVLLQDVEKLKIAVDEELERHSTGSTWGKPALQIMQLPGWGLSSR